MSNPKTVFIPSNNNANFEDLFSATSPVPEWTKVHTENGAQSDARHIMNDINSLLSDVRKETGGQSGGKPNKGRKASSKKAKKASSKKTKKVSAKKTKKVSAKKVKKASSKKAKKTSSKKAKKTSSKKTKKTTSKKVASPAPKKRSSSKKTKKSMQGGAKEMAQAMKNIQEVRKAIKEVLPDLKDGAVLVKTASEFLKKHDGDLEKTLKAIKSKKDEIEKIHAAAMKSSAEKKAAKKAAKDSTSE